MSAATTEQAITFDKWSRKQLPLGPAVKGIKGTTAMGRPSTGQVMPAVTGAGAAGANDVFIGVFGETIDNTAATNTTLLCDIDFLSEKTILWRVNDGSITSASLFNPCYFVDNQTVSATSTNRAKAGTIVAVDTLLGVGFVVGGF
jgi:hypothetical protein